jgi:hypothetical protein
VMPGAKTGGADELRRSRALCPAEVHAEFDESSVNGASVAPHVTSVELAAATAVATGARRAPVCASGARSPLRAARGRELLSACVDVDAHRLLPSLLRVSNIVRL